MGEFNVQLKTLIKKNLMLKSKSKCGLICECLFPIIIVMVLFAILFMINSFKAGDNIYSLNGFNSMYFQLNNSSKLIYGNPDGSLTIQQEGVIQVLKNQLKLVRNSINVDQGLDSIEDSYFLEINNKKQMEDYFKENSKQVYGGIWFPDSSLASKDTPFKYNIRLDSDETLNNEEQEVKNENGLVYVRGKFTKIQSAMDQAIFGFFGLNKSLNITAQLFPDPYVKQWEKWIDGRDQVFKNAGSIFVTAGLFIFGFRLITDVVFEKEQKIREAMKMMGLNDLAYFLSWMITSLVTAVPVSLIICLILKGSQVVYHTSWIVVIVTLILYVISLLLLAMVMGMFFDKSRFAGLISFIIVLALNLIGIFISYLEFSPSVKLLLSLVSPIAIACSFHMMAVRDLTLILNVNWNYLLSENQVIGMLILDIFLYIFLIFYLDNTIPSEFGTKKKWNFIFTKSYWLGTSVSDESIDLETKQNDDVELIPMDIKNNVTVSIKNLRKEFQTGDGLRVAVNDLNLEVFQDQIHAFLGPNGSGKSTTIGMLTGLIEPTCGTASIQGNDIRNQMSKVRRSLGICLQTDVIWGQLSVLEHLVIYATLKGITKGIKREAEKMAIEVGLGEKIHSPASSLSGGQKRKLCLGIAFIGRSTVCILDEPTSGMDPLSRRGVWDFLLKYKKGRTIILTTHYMDEAEILGDRIAIISFGKLKCDGSSLFLKQKYGCGYLLTCSKTLSTINQFNTDRVTRFVQGFIPEATVLSDAGGELSYRFPTSSVKEFSNFFREFDEMIEEFGISTYGISVTTLEEVFLKIGHEASNENFLEQITKNGEDISQETLKANIATAPNGITAKQQLKGLLIKRIRTSLKDIKSLFLTIILPLLFIVGSIILLKVMDEEFLIYNQVTTPLVMNVGMFGPNNQVPIQALSENDYKLLKSSSPYSDEFVQIKNQDTEEMKQFLIENYKKTAGSISLYSSIIQDPFISYKVGLNPKRVHSGSAYINLVNDAILRNHTDIGIQLTSMPFNHVLTDWDKAAQGMNIKSVVYYVVIICGGFGLMGGSFAGNVAQERMSRVKRLLYISGCKKYIYWVTNLIWDYIFVSILILITCILLTQTNDKYKDNFGLFFVGLVLLCICIIPLSYLLSYKFTTHAKATGAISAIHIGVGVVLLVIVLVLRIQVIVKQKEVLQDISDILDIIFCIVSPIFAFSKILLLVSDFPGSLRLGQSKIDDYWAFKAGSLPVIILALHCLIWIPWILLLDYSPEIKGYLKNPKNVPAPLPPPDEDSDVTDERARLEKLSPQDEVVQIKGLYKMFPGKGKNPDKIAVYNTTLGIPRGQTFGLLGLNGAGKTTTLSALCGDIVPTSGEILINGFDLITQRSQALSNIAYCPQFDALSVLLSAREQLWLYCRIKGIPEEKISNVVESFIKMMDLNRIANSNCGGYSGGNKRKLSLSIAMLGAPALCYLDEPSTGCDPVVRRYLWNVVSELSKVSSIIITTHSMEECQALCGRVTIMKEGKFMCLGSIQHVKNKFGSGYSFDVKFKKEFLEGGVQQILKYFPNAKVIDQHDLIASFELQNQQLKVSEIFHILQNDLGSILDDYSVSQTSLEQVFLKLTGASYENRLNNIKQISD
ncbi:hypothetical protein DICPUDRAFT_50951 [Dictyostelium purpureum]|uniref:ABC transporter domain-containing protein n=1 Tax=Dictyostelium purpureum TaxID=5786 RepID=F1A163_DICPU|nr:uncharacterized protein DICPUDRAFT_50951 [Dictyostelium purpureum]EGC30067.1 hypothetical protein DICPUDRAFT_50951 [Dictyostelium purpureum]|eukprot:XP_003293413.1 hypothetical protein DICPUDRAFT_50951 [Dictyostelium purpureum]